MSYISDIAYKIKQAIPDKQLPDERTDTLFLIYAVLALSKGENVTKEDVHNAWAAWMTTVEPMHESIVPYDSLSLDTKREDEPYVEAIRKVAKNLN